MKVVVYSSPTCGYCRQLKQFLVQRGVEFTEWDVSVDASAAAEMIKKTGQRGVPVTIIDDQVIVGFDRARLEHLLAAKGGTRPPSFGVKVADASKCAQKHGVIPIFGALVGGIKPGSPGERAGLKQDDVITEANLRRIHNVDDLEQALSNLSPGSRLTVVFQRGTDEYRAEAVL
jgi:glutaredoxin 3